MTEEVNFGLWMLKSEADIVRGSLLENACRCDGICVCDNAGTRHKMERVRGLGQNSPRIVPFGSSLAPVELRLRYRRKAASRGGEGFPHNVETGRRDKIVPFAGLHLDPDHRKFLVDYDKPPRHVSRPWVRVPKRILHGGGILP